MNSNSNSTKSSKVSSHDLNAMRESLRSISKFKPSELIFWVIAFATPLILPSHDMMIS